AWGAVAPPVRALPGPIAYLAPLADVRLVAVSQRHVRGEFGDCGEDVLRYGHLDEGRPLSHAAPPTRDPLRALPLRDVTPSVPPRSSRPLAGWRRARLSTSARSYVGLPSMCPVGRIRPR